MTTRHYTLCEEFRNVAQNNKHTRSDLASLTGMTLITIRRIYNKPKGWTMQLNTERKIQEYLSVYGSDNKSEIIPTRTSKPVPVIKEDYTDVYNLKIKSILGDTFIKSYNKLLNPLGYQVKIAIEPLVV